MTETPPETSIVEIIVAEAARHHKRFDSLEQSMLEMQTELRNEIKDAIATSEKNMTNAIQDLRTEVIKGNADQSKKLETAFAEMKTDMRWMFRISMVILGSLAALLIQSFLG